MKKQNPGKGFNKAVSVCIIALLTLGQVPEVFGGQNAANPAQATRPVKLNIVIVEGDGAINNIQQRVAREAIVQVNDENDRPVAGALILFSLPTSGPGGTFANGNVISVASDAAGRATATYTPNSVGGSFQINVTASFQGLTATAVIQQRNNSSGNSEGLSTTTIVMIAGAAAAAVAIGVVASRKGEATSAGPTIRIGNGTPTIGAPGGWAPSTSRQSSRPKWRD